MNKNNFYLYYYSKRNCHKALCRKSHYPEHKMTPKYIVSQYFNDEV